MAPPIAVNDTYRTAKNTVLQVGSPGGYQLDLLLLNEANWTFRKRAAGPPLGAHGAANPHQGIVRAWDFEDLGEAATNPYIMPPSGQPRNGPWPTGIYTHAGGTNVNWKLDTFTRSSKTRSFLIRTPPQGGADAAGSLQIPFLDDILNAANRERLYAGQNETLQWQYRIRFNAAMMTPYAVAGNNQWKTTIMGQGNRVDAAWPPVSGSGNDPGGLAGSCSPIEIVEEVITYHVLGDNPGPRAYHSCGSSPYGGFHNFGQTAFPSPSHTAEQNAIGTSQATRCVHPNYLANCFVYEANTWYTVRFRVDIGTWDSPNSRIRVWVTKDGAATVLVIDSQVFVDNETADAGYRLATPDSSYKYGKLWVLPYITGRNSGVSHPPGEGLMHVDEILIAKGPKGIPDPPQRHPIVNAILAMNANEVRELTAGGDPIGPGTGWTANMLANYSGQNGVLTAWSGKAAWNPIHKLILFAGTGHNPAGNVMQLLRYRASTHAWSKHDFTAPPGRGPWTHGYDMNASSWYDGVHYWDVSDGDVQAGERFADPLNSPSTMSTIPNQPLGGASHLGNPQEWFPTIGTVGRLVHYDGWNGLYSFDPITQTWTLHADSAAINAITGGNDLHISNNYQWMRYHAVADRLIFGGGGSGNKIVRMAPDGTLTRIGQTGAPMSTIPAGTDCNVVPSPYTNELFVLDGRTNQVWALDVIANTWTRRTDLENIFGFLDDVSPQGATSEVWGKPSCCLYEYGAILFFGGSVSDARVWLWKPV